MSPGSPRPSPPKSHTTLMRYPRRNQGKTWYSLIVKHVGIQFFFDRQNEITLYYIEDIYDIFSFEYAYHLNIKSLEVLVYVAWGIPIDTQAHCHPKKLVILGSHSSYKKAQVPGWLILNVLNRCVLCESKRGCWIEPVPFLIVWCSLATFWLLLDRPHVFNRYAVFILGFFCPRASHQFLDTGLFENRAP